MKKTVKKRKVKKSALFILFIIFILILFAVFFVFNFHITNIYIIDNTIYNDQEIIDMAGLSNYPRTFNNNELIIKNKLEKNKYIKKAKVTKKNFFREVYIKVQENKPIFYYNNETILIDGTKTKDIFEIPTLINEVNDTKIYNKLIKSINDINNDIYVRISEIKYDPNKVDKQRFKFLMNDGNYVYVTLRKIDRINNYIDIISTFEGKKGILYLDSGEYFELFGGGA